MEASLYLIPSGLRMQAQAPADSSRPAELPISAQLASLAGADATAPCGARLRGRSGERGALRAASTQQTRTAAKQLLYVLLTFTTQLALIAIATLSALYVNFTQTLHKRSMAATSGRRIVAGWLLRAACTGAKDHGIL